MMQLQPITGKPGWLCSPDGRWHEAGSARHYDPTVTEWRSDRPDTPGWYVCSNAGYKTYVRFWDGELWWGMGMSYTTLQAWLVSDRAAFDSNRKYKLKNQALSWRSDIVYSGMEEWPCD